jgi:hypothetical protein
MSSCWSGLTELEVLHKQGDTPADFRRTIIDLRMMLRRMNVALRAKVRRADRGKAFFVSVQRLAVFELPFSHKLIFAGSYATARNLLWVQSCAARTWREALR